jgi:N6-adenosine-specific RNA methylase IME4
VTLVKYRTIVADPPWDIPFGSNRTPPKRGGWAAEKWARAEVRDLPYPTMTTDEMCALPVSEMAEDAAHLYVWTVNRFLEDTYSIVRTWGFRPAQLLTWCKAPMGLGLGGTFTPTTEHVLFARRGVVPTIERADSTWWQWKRGAHSAKPEAFLDLVEQVSPGPYLELFARRQRLGWDTWGNECRCDVEMTA